MLAPQAECSHFDVLRIVKTCKFPARFSLRDLKYDSSNR